jgi:hypothetical protein
MQLLSRGPHGHILTYGDKTLTAQEYGAKTSFSGLHFYLNALRTIKNAYSKPGVVAHTCNPSTQEAKAGGLSLRPA